MVFRGCVPAQGDGSVTVSRVSQFTIFEARDPEDLRSASATAAASAGLVVPGPVKKELPPHAAVPHPGLALPVPLPPGAPQPPSPDAGTSAVAATRAPPSGAGVGTPPSLEAHSSEAAASVAVPTQPTSAVAVAQAEPSGGAEAKVEPSETPEAKVEPSETPEAKLEPSETLEAMVGPSKTPEAKAEPSGASEPEVAADAGPPPAAAPRHCDLCGTPAPEDAPCEEPTWRCQTCHDYVQLQLRAARELLQKCRDMVASVSSV